MIDTANSLSLVLTFSLIMKKLYTKNMSHALKNDKKYRDRFFDIDDFGSGAHVRKQMTDVRMTAASAAQAGVAGLRGLSF